MKRQIAWMFALLAVLIAVALFLLRNSAPVTPKQESSSLILCAGEAISLDLRNASGAYVLENGGISGIPKEVFDTDRASLTLRLLSNLSAVALVEAEPKETAQYGLNSASAQARIAYTSGTVLELTLGNREPVTDSYYCNVDGTSAVYLIAKSTAETLLLSKDEYVSRQITPPCMANNSLSAILDIRFETAEESIELLSCATPDEQLRREMISFGAVTHLVRGPGLFHEVDRTYAVEIFDSLLDLYAQEIVDFAPDDQLQARFEAPDQCVRFTLKNGNQPDTPVENWVLRLLIEADGRALVMVDGRNVVYRIAHRAFMDAEYEHFVMRWFVSPMMMDVRALELRVGDCEQRFEIGGTSAAPEVYRNGEVVEIDSFRALYTLVVSAANDGTPLQLQEMNGTPLASVRYCYTDVQKADDILQFYEKDTRTLYVCMNGVTEFSMRRKYLDALVAAMDAMENGVPIVSQW